jgi:hypothetical protein
MSTNYEQQAVAAEEAHAKWWGAFRALATEIGAKLVYPGGPDEVNVELPEGWTQEAFFAEVDRRAVPVVADLMTTRKFEWRK